MKYNYPGLYLDKTPAGTERWMVRKEGEKSKRMRIPVSPDHVDFLHHYYAARAGERWEPKRKVTAPKHSFRWLVQSYLEKLESEVSAGSASPITLRKRKSQLLRLCEHTDSDGDAYGTLDLDMPPAAFVRARNAMAATPAEADNTLKAVRAMYRHAIELALVETNPAEGIAKIHISKGGAIPWSADDLRAFRKAHPPGTMPHLYLTLLMFTGCRIEDAAKLGRSHEVRREGQVWLEWQPSKKGSAPVSMPMAKPLFDATRAMTVQGQTYILNSHGRPFKSSASLGVRARKWLDSAGLQGRSSHGVRKALAEFLAEAGCTQHQIMAILSHTQAKTSEIYTKGAERRALAASAAQAMGAIKW